jgi:hypothetical protein
VESGGIAGIAFQNANAAEKPGRSPPVRRSTTLDHSWPTGVSVTGPPVPKPVPSLGSSLATCAAYTWG